MHIFTPLGKGRQGQLPTQALLSCTLGLIYQFCLRKSQHCQQHTREYMAGHMQAHHLFAGIDFASILLH